jgi:peptidyl-prolyl cis-trans isomerase B (cyclophilin B)
MYRALAPSCIAVLVFASGLGACGSENEQGGVSKMAKQEEAREEAAADQANDEIAMITVTDFGVIELEFYPSRAPNHVENFKKLARSGFYDGTKFHRVIPGFMIQGGDPNTKGDDTGTWGTGGPGYQIDAEFNQAPHLRGTLSMARTDDPNSAGSQFFICVAPSPFLDGQYTVFGKVTEGMDVAEEIVNAPRDRNDRPFTNVVVESIKIEKAS